MTTPNGCPRAHKACPHHHHTHHCWRNPGHPGPHSCICYHIWKDNTDDHQ